MVEYENRTKERGVKKKEREKYLGMYGGSICTSLSFPQAAPLTPGGEVNQLKVPKRVLNLNLNGPIFKSSVQILGLIGDVLKKAQP